MMTIKHTNLLKGVVVMTEPRKPRLANRKEMLQAQPYCPERWQVISRVHQRELCSLFKCQAVYAVLSLSLLATGLILQTHLNFVQEQGLFVTSGALNGLLQAIIFLVSLVLGLSIVTSIGHEQAAGMTADAFSDVLGKYLARVTSYLVLAIIYGCCLAILAALANFSFFPNLIWIGLASVLITAQVVALAIFLASLLSQGQVARNLFLSIMLALLVIQGGPEALTQITPQGVYDPLILSVQHGLASLRWTVSWISPYAHLNRGIEAAMIGHQATYLGTLLSAALQASLFLSLSLVILQRQEGSK
jgi:hypothetical protein